MHDVGNLTELSGEVAPEARAAVENPLQVRRGQRQAHLLRHARRVVVELLAFRDQGGLSGAHWMAYDPNTGRVEDFGLGVPNEGINTGNYDPLFNRIYGLTHPRAHFVYYDVKTRKAVDKGRINNWESICRTLGVDDEGNVYGSFGKGEIFKYDPRTDAITELDVRLPIREKGISLGRDYNKSETAWRTVVWDPRPGSSSA